MMIKNRQLGYTTSLSVNAPVYSLKVHFLKELKIYIYIFVKDMKTSPIVVFSLLTKILTSCQFLKYNDKY